jgi:MoaA/NifB/PqqE/SkfB family radical SAM enzyme
VLPILSIEGFEQATDQRRGTGVYRSLRKAIDRLSEKGLFFGISLTLTRDNFDTLTGDELAESLVKAGCRVFVYVEYTPVEDDTKAMVLTSEQKSRIDTVRKDLQSRHSAAFVAFPGDETPYRGCLAAGRGFIHIAPDGSLEPCPFAPFSDTNVASMSLKDALKSDFLAKLRDGHERLTESEGGCELWANRDWVRSLLHTSTDKNAD